MTDFLKLNRQFEVLLREIPAQGAIFVAPTDGEWSRGSSYDAAIYVGPEPVSVAEPLRLARLVLAGAGDDSTSRVAVAELLGRLIDAETAGAVAQLLVDRNMLYVLRVDAVDEEVLARFSEGVAHRIDLLPGSISDQQLAEVKNIVASRWKSIRRPRLGCRASLEACA